MQPWKKKNKQEHLIDGETLSSNPCCPHPRCGLLGHVHGQNHQSLPQSSSFYREGELPICPTHLTRNIFKIHYCQMVHFNIVPLLPSFIRLPLGLLFILFKALPGGCPVFYRCSFRPQGSCSCTLKLGLLIHVTEPVGTVLLA